MYLHPPGFRHLVIIPLLKPGVQEEGGSRARDSEEQLQGLAVLAYAG